MTVWAVFLLLAGLSFVNVLWPVCLALMLILGIRELVKVVKA